MQNPFLPKNKKDMARRFGWSYKHLWEIRRVATLCLPWWCNLYPEPKEMPGFYDFLAVSDYLRIHGRENKWGEYGFKMRNQCSWSKRQGDWELWRQKLEERWNQPKWWEQWVRELQEQGGRSRGRGTVR